MDGESAINNATVFVYQTDVEKGIETLYNVVYTTSTSIDVQLLFNESKEYVYRFDAYANMGELNSVPEAINFSNETTNNFQMHGSLDNVSKSSSENAVVMLDRYVSRIVIQGIKLQWKDEENASQDFYLKRFYIANAAGQFDGTAGYNNNGIFTSSEADVFLVSDVNEVITNGGMYSVPHYLYAYSTETTALVLECEWAGQTMYYHLDFNIEGNDSLVYNLTICQTGSSTPLGELTDDSLIAVGGLVVNDWNIIENESTFGDPSDVQEPSTDFGGHKVSMILDVQTEALLAYEFNTNVHKVVINGEQEVLNDELSNVISFSFESIGEQNVDFYLGDNSNALDCSYMFKNYNGIKPKHIDLNGAKVCSFQSFCEGLTTLESVDLSDCVLTGPDDDDLSGSYFLAAFSGCSNLTSVNFSRFSTERTRIMIGDVFENCTSMSHVDLSGIVYPSKVYFFNTFIGCTSLESVDFGTINAYPDGELSLDQMFMGCNGLEDVTVRGNIYSENNIMFEVFKDCNSNGTFHYESSYDYSQIIDILPESWTSVAISE